MILDDSCLAISKLNKIYLLSNHSVAGTTFMV